MTQSLINAEGRVLAAVDSSVYAPHVAELAGWAAARLGAALELVHAIDRNAATAPADLSGSLSFGAQESLLAELAALDEKRSKLAQAHSWTLLEQLQTKVLGAHAVNASLVQRHGALVDVLLDLEPQVRLFVIGARGEHAGAAPEHLGSNLERVVRAVHRPVLVSSGELARIERFLIAYDGSATTRKCVEMVALSPLLRGLECHLLLVGCEDAQRRVDLTWAQDRLVQAGFALHARMREGVPDSSIASYMQEHAIDLLVMGAYGHSRIRSMILGSTTTQLLRSSRGAVLLLR